MTKTLADMTEEERTQCVGMWCEDVEGALGIYLGEAVNNEWVGVCVHPPSIYPFSSVFQDLTPRPDLPRAWGADGTPPAGEWEYEYTLTDGCSPTTGEHVPSAGPNQKIRRWKGEWEEA